MEIEIQILLFVLIGYSVVCHEVAHGAVALLLGDPTSHRAGRLTLNPLPHIDPFGTVLLPVLLAVMHSPVIFAWAKPVPVNPFFFKRPKHGMMLVAAAGPATNLALAGLCAGAVHLLAGSLPLVVLQALILTALMNVMLAAFNLIPIPPLDGSRIVAAFLPRALLSSYMSLEPYGMFIVFALIASGAIHSFLHNVLAVMEKVLGFG